jgi:hypothetical protein
VFGSGEGKEMRNADSPVIIYFMFMYTEIYFKYEMVSQTYWYSVIGCHKFTIENGLKRGDALSPLLFNFALEYAIRRV